MEQRKPTCVVRHASAHEANLSWQCQTFTWIQVHLQWGRSTTESAQTGWVTREEAAFSSDILVLLMHSHSHTHSHTISCACTSLCLDLPALQPCGLFESSWFSGQTLSGREEENVWKIRKRSIDFSVRVRIQAIWGWSVWQTAVQCGFTGRPGDLWWWPTAAVDGTEEKEVLCWEVGGRCFIYVCFVWMATQWTNYTD